MSDVDRSICSNVSLSYFDKSYQIKSRRNRPLANIYISTCNHDMPVFGTMYFFHGYGGSPIEPCMKVPMQLAKSNGFDVVAIEGVDLSATSGTEKQLSAMTLARQKVVIARALQFCNDITELNQEYRISWVHSMSGRAMTDLCVYSPFVRNYFNEHVLANPYFVAPGRVRILFDRMMRIDPTGQTWLRFIHKTSTKFRTIENVQYQFPASLYNLNVPLPKAWALSPNDIASQMATLLNGNYVTFLLGTKDDMAEYDMNMMYYQALPTSNKNLVLIDGGDHALENSIAQLANASRQILQNIQQRRLDNTRQQA